MIAMPFQVSACRHCRYYTPEGRRGGQCRQFDAIVRAGWKACPLAMPAFAPSWESLERLVSCQDESVALETTAIEFEQEPALRLPTPMIRSTASVSVG